VQRVIKDVGGNFSGVEKELSDFFLPALFDAVISSDDPRQKVACLPVKFAGLSLSNPVDSADLNYEASILTSSYILAAFFRGVQEFRSADHSSTVREVRSEIKRRNKMIHEVEMERIVNGLPCDDRRTILRGRDTGQWLSVKPSTVN
jgi:hypothetical protein